MTIFIITWVFWFLTEVLLNRLFQSKIVKPKGLAKKSLVLIWITLVMVIPAGAVCALRIPAPIDSSTFLWEVGLLVILFGIMIRFIAVLTLGRFFTMDLAIHHDHRLVKTGLYKYIRHPSYTGSLVSILGLGLSINNWISLAIIFIPLLVSFLYRIHVEERLLLEVDGLGYDEYKRQTKRLIPLVY